MWSRRLKDSPELHDGEDGEEVGGRDYIYGGGRVSGHHRRGDEDDGDDPQEDWEEEADAVAEGDAGGDAGQREEGEGSGHTLSGAAA